jgi:hypothetical protein
VHRLKKAAALDPGKASEFQMTVLKPRSRMISVRLSEDEYHALHHLCSVTGARSVSDLARDAMNMVLQGANRDGFPGPYMNEFRNLMRNLDSKIEQLAVDLTSVKSKGKP